MPRNYKRELVCAGHIDPTEDPLVPAIPSIIVDSEQDARRAGWRLVKHKLFTPGDERVWICPKCVKEFVAYLQRVEQETLQDAASCRTEGLLELEERRRAIESEYEATVFKAMCNYQNAMHQLARQDVDSVDVIDPIHLQLVKNRKHDANEDET